MGLGGICSCTDPDGAEKIIIYGSISVKELGSRLVVLSLLK